MGKPKRYAQLRFVMKNAFIHTLLSARDYQDRPEFEQLCDWWREGGTGVCTLVGMGGAGKTAIVERFLRVLPGGLPAPKSLGKRTDLPQPESLFVFSFYEAPNADSFFGQVHSWLRGEAHDESAPLPSYEQVFRELERADGRLFLVLDGFEKTQDDGMRGGAFGHILDGRLRNLVMRAADGYLSDISLLITSRFPLWDLSADRCSCSREIPIDKLDPTTAVALLRARGVRGTNQDLNALAREQGYHALTVDLMGGYISEFCKGDPSKLESLAEPPHVPDDEPDTDPRKAAVREQEHRFSRVAARYRESFKKSDPAALALLQRICLFRLGVSAETLASIFLSKGKKGISGAPLAALSVKDLHAKLKHLVLMRLLDEHKSGTGDKPVQMYTLHPAVRDGFSLDTEAAASSHEAIRESLTGLLTEGENPSDPAVLDLLEEIIHHTLSAGHAQEAFDVYWFRMGHYGNLGHRLGAHARGERICRAFVSGRPPESAPLPDGLSENDQSVFINGWALYMKLLGRLGAAACCYERGNEICMRQENWKSASVGNQNLAEVCLAAGKLHAVLAAAQEALRLAEQADDADERRDSHASVALALGFVGDTPAALTGFAEALRLQNEVDGDDDPLYGGRGVHHTSLLALLGRLEEAARLTKGDIDICLSQWGPDNLFDPQCRLVLADIARMKGDLPDARQSLAKAHDWAIARDDKYILCWAALVRARIVRNAGDLGAAQNAVDEGLRIALECGYGIHHINLLLVQAEIRLLQSDADGAEQALRTALFEGVHPPTESRNPELLAATDEQCGYAWGISEGRYLLGQTYLLCAAQKLGSDAFVPARRAQLPAAVKDLIAQAESELAQAEELCKRMAPDGKSEIPLAAKVGELYADLGGGVLTRYPLQKAAEPLKEETPMPAGPKRFHVALSFPGEHRAFIKDVADSLAAKIGKEHVFYDKYYEAELARPDLDTYLQALYHDDSELIVPFLCKKYDEKEWCKLEWRSVRDLLKKKQAETIMPFRFDETHIPGLFSIDGYIDANGRTPAEIADLILQRLDINRKA